jgi:hypothetical protein
MRPNTPDRFKEIGSGLMRRRYLPARARAKLFADAIAISTEGRRARPCLAARYCHGCWRRILRDWASRRRPIRSQGDRVSLRQRGRGMLKSMTQKAKLLALRTILTVRKPGRTAVIMMADRCKQRLRRVSERGLDRGELARKARSNGGAMQRRD